MNLEKEIEALKDRNHRVEADKAWETSWMRRLSVLVLTYILVVIFFYVAGLPDPFFGAVVPTVAFLVTNMTMPFLKRVWVAKVYKK